MTNHDINKQKDQEIVVQKEVVVLMKISWNKVRLLDLLLDPLH